MTTRLPSRSKQAATVPGLAPRRAALRLLDAVMRRGEPLEVALHAAGQGLSGPDRALAHAIAAAVLRRIPDLDDQVDSKTAVALPEDAKARMVLRMALAQIHLLETPAHAVIATALPLVDGGPRRLVHGVLGALIRDGTPLPDPPTLPPEVAARWHAQWGADMTAAAARALASRAPIDLTLADAVETARIADATGGTALMPGHVRVGHDVAVPGLPGYAEGRWWVQDIAASLPARLAGHGEGRAAIDLCAAPGGKTMQLAAQGWAVTALDKSAKRLERMTENLKRSGLDATIEPGDALQWAPRTPVDLVLIDAPCSATGIFRRHPDVLHRAGARHIAEMAQVQRHMLARAADWVAPGGLLIYATCSLEREEGEDQMAAFLENRADFAVESPRADELPPELAPTEEGYLRILPGMMEAQGGADGFFIARLRRAGG